MNEENERAILRQLRIQIDRGVCRYQSILAWAISIAGDGRTLQLKDLEAEVRRRLAMRSSATGAMSEPNS